MARYDYLIVGGGMTADAAAHGIRREDTKGSIAMVGADSHAPYNRPPLTKGLWKGDPEDSIWRKTGETGAELVRGRRIVRVDAGREARQRRQRRFVRLRNAPPRDRWPPSPARGCAGRRRLLPHLRRLPPAARARRSGRRASSWSVADSSAPRSRPRSGCRIARSRWCSRARGSAKASIRRSCRAGWWTTIAGRESRFRRA